MKTTHLKSVLFTLVTLATLASLAPAHAALLLGDIQRVVVSDSGFGQNTVVGSFTASSGVAPNNATQVSLIDLTVLPQFSGTGTASIDVAEGTGESQSFYSVVFTIPIGETYNYTLRGNVAAGGTADIVIAAFDLVNFADPTAPIPIVEHDFPSTFTDNGSLGSGTYRVHAIARFSTEDGGDANGAWEFEMSLTPVTTSLVPEPASVTLWSLGALGCAVAYRRRRPSGS